eukprot:UN11715
MLMIFRKFSNVLVKDIHTVLRNFDIVLYSCISCIKGCSLFNFLT